MNTKQRFVVRSESSCRRGGYCALGTKVVVIGLTGDGGKTPRVDSPERQ